MHTRIMLPLVLAAVTAFAGIVSSAAQVPDRSSASPAVRGLWVLRASLTSPDRISQVVRSAQEGGYNTLLVQVRGRGDAYYASTIEPRSPDLRAQPTSFDPLATMIDAAHAAGLNVHAWVNVNLVSSAVSLSHTEDHVVSRRPEWLMVPRALTAELYRVPPDAPGYVDRLARWTRTQSGSVEGLYLSPTSDQAQDYTANVIGSLAAAYPVDGIHLDYIRYPSQEFDYSRATLDAFRAARASVAPAADIARLDLAVKTDPTAWTRAYPDGWATFRRDRVTALVRKIHAVVKQARPGVILSSAVIADPVEARERALQDWPTWAAEGLVDVICPMAYATTTAAFDAQVLAATAIASGRPVWVGVGAWRLPVAQAAAHVARARRSGAAGVLIFSYDSLVTAGSPAGSYLSQLRPSLLSAGIGPPR